VEIILILLGVSIPLGFYFWKQSRRGNPAVVWPDLARRVEFQYQPDPPRLNGDWKGRKFVVTADQGDAVLSTALQCRSQIRVEIGLKSEIESEAGMIVHDRVELNDPGFEERYMVRATPRELGEAAADPATRQRLLRIPDMRILAVSNQLQIRTPAPTEPGDLRELLDVASSVADSLDD